MKIEIFGKENCAACESARILATNSNAEVVYKKLDTDYTLDELLAKYQYVRTFPQIWVNDEHIGGFTEFKAYMENSK
jgi:glutaredoxin